MMNQIIIVKMGWSKDNGLLPETLTMIKGIKKAQANIKVCIQNINKG